MDKIKKDMSDSMNFIKSAKSFFEDAKVGFEKSRHLGSECKIPIKEICYDNFQKVVTDPESNTRHDIDNYKILGKNVVKEVLTHPCTIKKITDTDFTPSNHKQIMDDPYYKHMPKDDVGEATRYASNMGGEDSGLSCYIF